nr:RecName: Full=Carboxypeptidase B; Flags: Precursor [Protopterus aethiopicus]
EPTPRSFNGDKVFRV